MKTKNIIVFLIPLFSQFCTDLFSQKIECDFKPVKVICSEQETGKFIINNRSDYLKICPSIENPLINFSEKVLVGIVYSAYGCTRPSVRFGVIKDIKNKRITCTFFIEDTGNCRRIHPIISWFVIDKPDSEYSIEVKTE